MFFTMKNFQMNMSVKQLVGLFVSIVSFFLLWFAPDGVLGISNLTVVEQRVIAIFVFAALMWIFESIPIWSTSVLTIVLLLLMVSDSGFKFMNAGYDPETLGVLVKHKSLMATFADPIIMLFLGGFVLAIAATRCGIDAYIAKNLLAPFGTKSHFVMLGFILSTAIFSMFMSNTATAAMMIAILAPVLRNAEGCNGAGKVGLTLAIPIAANVGGIGTPIGTPPNAIALKYLNDPDGLNLNIGFGEWMMFMVPFVFVLLAIVWFILLKMFPFEQKRLEIKIESKLVWDRNTIITCITFFVTVVLWMLDKVTGVNANTVALIPLAIFTVTGVIRKEDLKDISWDVLWLVAGGFALGVGLQETGLAKHLVESIPFGQWSPVLLIVASGLICCVLSTFISNTATAALMMPILFTIGTSMEAELAAFGGVTTLLVGIAGSASLAMALPISTPPNALAHSTGLTRQADMAKIGIIVGVIGLTLLYLLLLFLGKSLF